MRLAIGAALTALLLGGCGGAEQTATPAPEATTHASEPDRTEAPDRWTEDDIEYKLAAIGEGTRNPDNATIERYAGRLDEAEEAFTDERTPIADCTVRAHQLATENGADETILSMLDAAVGSVPPEAEGTLSCVDVYAALLALMDGQN